MAQGPFTADVPYLIRLKYTCPVNRWTRLANEGIAVATLLQATGGDRSRSSMWRDILSAYGVRDVASAVFADAYGSWAWLDLWRDGSDREFSSDEINFLAAVAPAITRALRAARSRQFSVNDVGAGLPQQAVLMMDGEMRMAGQTRTAARWLHLLQRAPEPHAGVAAEVFNVVGQLLAKEASIDSHAAASRVHIGGGNWASFRAARMEGREGATDPLIAVTIQECMPSARLGMFVRCHALSPRERQAVALAAAGLGNTAIAERMSVAPYTVQDHFKSVFAKTGTHTRGAVLALGLGRRAILEEKNPQLHNDGEL